MIDRSTEVESQPAMSGNQRSNWQDEFPVPDQYLDLGPARLHYVDRGAGQPLLMVHGNPTWSFHFRHLIDHFQPRYRCVAVDHIGCGWSDKPQQYRYCLDQHATNLQRLVEQLDLRQITLIAHDWGGAIGLLAASRLRDRFARCVLLNTAAFPPPYIPWRIRACRIPVLGTIGVRGANLFALAAQMMAVEQRQRLSPTARAGLLAPYHSWADRVAIDRFVQDIPSSERHPTWPVLEQLETDLRRHPLPALLIWGQRDWCFRLECLRRLEAIFPDHQTVELQDVGHWVLEEAPDRVIGAMETFLSDRGRNTA